MRNHSLNLLLAFASALSLGNASGQTLTPYLVRDIDRRTVPTPQRVGAVYVDGDEVYYMAGNGLWHSNGSRLGNYRLTTANGLVGGGHGLTMFLGVDDVSPQRPTAGITDGTTPGTRLLPHLLSTELFTSAAACGSQVCFSVGSNFLARTDGTQIGTSLIVSTEPSITGNNLPLNVTSVGGKVFFKAYDFAYGQCTSLQFGNFCGELWASDGTAAGTHLVADVLPGPAGSSPEFFFPWKNKLLFTAFRPDFLARQFYISDGTAAGTTLLTDKSTVAIGFSARYAVSGQYLYFAGSDGQWFRTDGTPQNITNVLDLVGLQQPASIRDVIAGNDRILFTVGRGLSVSSLELWTYDGSKAAKLGDLPAEFAAVGFLQSANKFLYAAPVNVYVGPEILYVTDGTLIGTPIASIPGNSVGPLLSASHYGFFNGGGALWQTDGRSAGTYFVENQTPSPSSSSPSSLISTGAYVYFFATDTDNLSKLFRSDGHDVTAVAECAPCTALTTVNGHVYYSRSNSLWVVDDDATSARSLASLFGSDLNVLTLPVHLGDADYVLAEKSGDRILVRRSGSATQFVTSLGTGEFTNLFGSDSKLFWGGSGLSASDGTAAGTVLLVSGEVNVRGPTPNGVYFEHREPDGSNGLWFSDGTLAGTQRLEPHLEGFGLPVAIWQGMIFFTGPNGSLWRADGTPTGTIQIPKGIDALLYAIDGGDRLVLIWGNALGQVEAWTTDGTQMGTVKTGAFTTLGIREPVRTTDGHVLLPVIDNRNASRAQFIDLTTGSTYPVNFDLYSLPVFAYGDPHKFAAAGRKVLFAATARNGTELWGVDFDQPTPAPQQSVSIEYSGVAEVGGKTVAIFKVEIEGAAAGSANVKFSTIDGTFVANRDYVESSGTLSFGTNETTRHIVIPVRRTGGVFSVILSEPENVRIDRGTSTALILEEGSRHRSVPH